MDLGTPPLHSTSMSSSWHDERSQMGSLPVLPSSPESEPSEPQAYSDMHVVRIEQRNVKRCFMVIIPG